MCLGFFIYMLDKVSRKKIKPRKESVPQVAEPENVFNVRSTV